MKKLLIPTILIALVALSHSEPKNLSSELHEEIKHANWLAENGFEEYAMHIVTGPAPSQKTKELTLKTFEGILIEHYPDEKKIRDHILNNANGRIELFWLMKLRLAERHYMNGNNDKSKEIYSAFTNYIERKNKKANN